MTKQNLIDVFASKLEVSKSESAEIIVDFIDTIKQGLREDGECVIPELGKFVLAKTPARSGVSKLNGVEKKWSKPEGMTIKFKLSKQGKDFAADQI